LLSYRSIVCLPCAFTCCSCFCRLLEQLHLLDVLRSAVAVEDQAAQQQAEQQRQQDEQREWYKVRQLLATSCAVPCWSTTLLLLFLQLCSCLLHRLACWLLLVAGLLAYLDSLSTAFAWCVLQLPRLASQLEGSFLSRLEQQLQAVPGMDAVLAALMMFCQQNQAAASKLIAQLASGSTNSSSSAGSGGKPEAIDVSCLSSIQEQHTAARALPLLLRLYFNNSSRAEVSCRPAGCALLHALRCS
jgi:hypothetical protein